MSHKPNPTLVIASEQTSSPSDSTFSDISEIFGIDVQRLLLFDRFVQDRFGIDGTSLIDMFINQVMSGHVVLKFHVFR